MFFQNNFEIYYSIVIYMGKLLFVLENVLIR